MKCATLQAGLWYKYGDDLYGFDLDRIFVDTFGGSFANNSAFITLVKSL
jgi:hypothetical protein